MSHKILAEKYAQQLNDAHKRILELETAVADREYELEQVREGGGPQKTDNQQETDGLRSDLAVKVQRIDELECQLKQHISNKDHMISTKLANTEAQLEYARSRLEDLKRVEVQRMETILDLQTQLENAQDRAETDVQAAKEHARSIEDWAKGEVDRMLQEKRQAVQQLDLARTSHEAQSGPASERIKFLEKALESSNRLALSQSADSLRVENDHLVKCIRETSGEKFDLRRKVTQLTRDAKRAASADKRVVELGKMLALERKRTLQAEALLGPDGRRCKKCHPVIIDLMDEDEDGNGESSETNAEREEGDEAEVMS